MLLFPAAVWDFPNGSVCGNLRKDTQKVSQPANHPPPSQIEERGSRHAFEVENKFYVKPERIS